MQVNSDLLNLVAVDLDSGLSIPFRNPFDVYDNPGFLPWNRRDLRNAKNGSVKNKLSQRHFLLLQSSCLLQGLFPVRPLFAPLARLSLEAAYEGYPARTKANRAKRYIGIFFT